MKVSSTFTCGFDHTEFDVYAERVRKRFAEVVGEGRPVFNTAASGLFEIYLERFDDRPVERQEHNCNCCSRFIETYGGLVAIDDKGRSHSIMWLRDGYEHALATAVEAAVVSSVFISDEKQWGTANTGPWRHFSVTPPASMVHQNALKTPFQRAAELTQDFETLSRGLADYSRVVVSSAVNLLESEALFRSEKVVGPARFLLDLIDQIDGKSTKLRRNLIWRAVSTAPYGWAQPRSSMIGTLLDDLKAGMPLDLIRARFADKMDPTKHMRPSEAPAAGNIAQAESIIAKLGLAPALERRFARLEELQLDWRPTPRAKQPVGGIFGHLAPKKSKAATTDAVAPLQNITWRKFFETVVPKAREIQVSLTRTALPLAAITTAVHQHAPQMLQWPNPFSWYVYSNGSSPENWGLRRSWVKVTGITRKPCHWDGHERFNHQEPSVFLLLEGAADRNNPGLAIFPEHLKSELHSIRATIEAHSRAGQLAGRDRASACGLMIGKAGSSETIRVTTDVGVADYRIDRWD